MSEKKYQIENVFRMFHHLNDALSYVSVGSRARTYAKAYLEHAKISYGLAVKSWKRADSPKGFTKYFKNVLSKMNSLESKLK